MNGTSPGAGRCLPYRHRQCHLRCRLCGRAAQRHGLSRNQTKRRARRTPAPTRPHCNPIPGNVPWHRPDTRHRRLRFQRLQRYGHLPRHRAAKSPHPWATDPFLQSRSAARPRRAGATVPSQGGLRSWNKAGYGPFAASISPARRSSAGRVRGWLCPSRPDRRPPRDPRWQTTGVCCDR